VSGVALLLGLAAAGHGAARFTSVPAIPLMIALGFGAAAAGWVTPESVEDVVFLSLSVLLFSAGTQLSPSKLRAHGPVTLRVAAAQFVSVGTGGFLVALLLGLGTVAALHVGVGLACSSTLVGVRILQRRRELFEPSGRLVTGVLLLQDLAVAVALPLLALAGARDDASLLPLAATLGMVVAAYVLSRILPRLVGDALEADPELALLGFLSLLFVAVAAGSALGVPEVTAAFVAGLTLSGFPIAPVARTQLESLTAFFGALFFTALGTILVVPSPGVLLTGMALAAVVVATTPVVVGLVAERQGLTARTSLAAGLLLAQSSEFTLVVGLQGTVTGLLPEEGFTALAIATLLTMAVTPVLSDPAIVERLVRLHPFREDPGPAAALEGHVVLLGGGTNGRAILDLLLTQAVPVALVEEDPAVIHALRPAGVVTVRADASDPAALAAAGISGARSVVCTLPRPADAEAALEAAGDVPVLVRVFEAAEEAWVRERGGIPISYAEAGADDFLAWYRGRGARKRGTG